MRRIRIWLSALNHCTEALWASATDPAIGADLDAAIFDGQFPRLRDVADLAFWHLFDGDEVRLLDYQMPGIRVFADGAAADILTKTDEPAISRITRTARGRGRS